MPIVSAENGWTAPCAMSLFIPITPLGTAGMKWICSYSSDAAVLVSPPECTEVSSVETARPPGSRVICFGPSRPSVLPTCQSVCEGSIPMAYQEKGCSVGCAALLAWRRVWEGRPLRCGRAHPRWSSLRASIVRFSGCEGSHAMPPPLSRPTHHSAQPHSHFSRQKSPGVPSL
eukprot:scaffold146909_cov27-Tisochrysis_lutea.AAC.1